MLFQTRAADLNHALAATADGTFSTRHIFDFQCGSPTPNFFLIELRPAENATASWAYPFGPPNEACRALQDRRNSGPTRMTELWFQFPESCLVKRRSVPVMKNRQLAFPVLHGFDDRVIPTVLPGYGPLERQLTAVVHAISP